MKDWLISVLLFLVFCLVLASELAAAQLLTEADSERPPQYVVLAFDGSKSVDMWKETRQFAGALNASGTPVKFTYFINSVYYVANRYKSVYQGPGKSRGSSAIGFGGSADEILARFEQTNEAFEDGHEIANHAAGHFDGTKWSESDWTLELREFYELLFNMFAHSHIQPPEKFPQGWMFSQAAITGFRAPQLGRGPALFKTLPRFGIQYDTSTTGKPAAWPRKVDGLWLFPLASIPVAGTSRSVLAMDYNFYYLQSKAVPDPARSAQYEEQMYLSYMNYFQMNYRGNRAPINIGHHFSRWNGGAYWRAMKRFAQEVCGQPEVECVTYQELVSALDRLPQTTLAQLQAPSQTTMMELFAESLMSEEFKNFKAPPLPEGLEEEKLLQADPPEAHEE